MKSFLSYYMSFKNNRDVSKEERNDLSVIINRIIVECRKPKYKDYDIKVDMKVKDINYTLDKKIKIEQWCFDLCKKGKTAG